MRARSLVLAGILAAVLVATPISAQLPPANDLGVRLGHVHLVVKDLEAHKHFWTSIGGTILDSGSPLSIQFPGVLIMLQQGDSTGPPADSIVDHFGFVVKDLTAARASWKTAKVDYRAGTSNPNQGYLYAPDGIRVEIFGDPSLPGPISMDHIHSYLPTADIPAIQSWYAKVLGGIPGKRQRVSQPGLIDCVYFHRFNVSFSPSDSRRAPTKGRSLDYLGFEVKNLDESLKRLEAEGIKPDSPARMTNSRMKTAMLTDPWGTSIELTEAVPSPATQ